MPGNSPVFGAISRRPLLFVGADGSQSALSLADISFSDNVVSYDGTVAGAEAWVTDLARSGQITPGPQLTKPAPAPAKDSSKTVTKTDDTSVDATG